MKTIPTEKYPMLLTRPPVYLVVIPMPFIPLPLTHSPEYA
jgi:hypothetical protein